MSSIIKFKEDLMKGENPELLKKVSTQNRKLKKRFDEEVIAKQNVQNFIKMNMQRRKSFTWFILTVDWPIVSGKQNWPYNFQ